jgi:hypothetical protein
VASTASQHAEDEEEQRPGLGHEHRVQGVPDLVVVTLPAAGPLGVALMPDGHQVRSDQGQDQARDEKHVRDVQPGDE